MGKRIYVQRRGRGSPTFRALTHRRRGAVKYPPLVLMTRKGFLVGTVEELLHEPGRGCPIAQLRLESGETYLKGKQMDFALSERVRTMIEIVRDFMKNEVYPLNRRWFTTALPPCFRGWPMFARR